MTTQLNNPIIENSISISSDKLEGQYERFDSFWEGPEDIEKGYRTFAKFYQANYLEHLPRDLDAKTLVISCGPGYFVNLLVEKGFTNVLGIDSDESKVEHAVRRGLNCQRQDAIEFLKENESLFDVIICEQELNHLTKREMLAFVSLLNSRMKSGGILICHGLNGANPIVGAETLAQNFDHFNTFTSYSLGQVLEHSGFTDLKIFGLHLYVFYKNPMNYVAWAASALFSITFRALFILYGKSNKIFSKKIAGVAIKR